MLTHNIQEGVETTRATAKLRLLALNQPSHLDTSASTLSAVDHVMLSQVKRALSETLGSGTKTLRTKTTQHPMTTTTKDTITSSERLSQPKKSRLACLGIASGDLSGKTHVFTQSQTLSSVTTTPCWGIDLPVASCQGTTSASVHIDYALLDPR